MGPDETISESDYLARERTRLANERTMLAYVRTALALFITGISAMHIPWLQGTATVWATPYYAAGGVLVLASVVAQVVGIRRYRRFADHLPTEHSR